MTVLNPFNLMQKTGPKAVDVALEEMVIGTNCGRDIVLIQSTASRVQTGYRPRKAGQGRSMMCVRERSHSPAVGWIKGRSFGIRFSNLCGNIATL